MEPGQDRKIAALTITFYVHFYFGDIVMDDELFMKLALDEAKKAYLENEVPVGCVIVKDNEIIGKGYNRKDSTGDVTKHAELIAIKEASNKLADWRLNACTLYVTLFPCPMCASAIVQSRIDRIVIAAGTLDPKNFEIVNLIFMGNATQKNVMVTHNVLDKECSKILKDFFKNNRIKKK